MARRNEGGIVRKFRIGLIWGRQLSNLVTERIAQTKAFTEWRP